MIHDAGHTSKEQQQRQRARTDDKLARRQTCCSCASEGGGLAALGGRLTGQREHIEKERHNSVARMRDERQHRRERNHT